MEKRRHAARDRFLTIWGLGFLLGLLATYVDLPRAMETVLAITWYAAAVLTGGAWLVLAVRDRSFHRAVPDYLYAALALAVIALGCAAAALLVLAALGEEITATGVTGWAAIGTLAVLVTYWIRRAWRPPPEPPRPR